MTLLEKIDAYVASQGNQVGGGSEFADMLKEIVNSIPQGGNEPLIVEGTYDAGTNEFTSNDGQPSWTDARTALESGTPVFLQFTDTSIKVTAQVMSCAYDEAGDQFISAIFFVAPTSNLTNIHWVSQ